MLFEITIGFLNGYAFAAVCLTVSGGFVALFNHLRKLIVQAGV